MKRHLEMHKLSVPRFVNSSAEAKLKKYVDHLDKWRKVTNLISDAAFKDIWNRHILDGLHLQALFSDYTDWLDLGSGTGLPAIVIATMLNERSGAHVHCVESDARKCVFLRSVVQDLAIPAKIHNARIERLPPSSVSGVQIVTAKAFASVQRILSLAEPFLTAGAVLALPRGETSRAEIEALDRARYKYVVHPNPAAYGGFVLEIRRL